jgi:cytochrome c peroxidase
MDGRRAESIAFGFKNEVSRNAPTVINAGLQRGTFYDMRTSFLEDQATAVLKNGDKIHNTLDEAVGELQNSTEYSAIFKKSNCRKFRERTKYPHCACGLRAFAHEYEPAF